MGGGEGSKRDGIQGSLGSKTHRTDVDVALV